MEFTEDPILKITATRPNPETLVLTNGADRITGTLTVSVGSVRHAVQYVVAPEMRGTLPGYAISVANGERTVITWTDEVPNEQNGGFFSRSIAQEAESMFRPTIAIPDLPATE